MLRKHWIFATLGALVIGASVWGIAAAVGPGPDGGGDDPSDPTERDGAMKATEAAIPLPTAIPPVSICPTSGEICVLAAAVREAMATSKLLELSRPSTIQCPPVPSIALAPLCSPGQTATGFYTGVFGKRYEFVDAASFEQFVRDTRMRAGGDRTEVLAVGCPVTGNVFDCSSFAAFTFGERGGDTVLVALLAGVGPEDLKVIGARSWAGTSLEAIGGSVSFEQQDLPYVGPMRFVPVSLP